MPSRRRPARRSRRLTGSFAAARSAFERADPGLIALQLPPLVMPLLALVAGILILLGR